MPDRHSLTVRLLGVVWLVISLVFALALGYVYFSSRATLEQEVREASRNLALSLVNRVETQLTAVQGAAAGVATALDSVALDEPALLRLLRATLERNPGLQGLGAAFESGAFEAGQRLYAPQYYREDGEIRFARRERVDGPVPYPIRDWYQIPRQMDRTEWSEPYFEQGVGSMLMSTCAVPFHGPDGAVRGVVAADVSLEGLTELVGDVRILETGYAALLSRNGAVLAHPIEQAIMNETFFSIAEARGDPALRALGREMVRGGSGFVHYRSLLGVESYMYYAPVSTSGWTLAVVFPEAELMAGVHRLTLSMAGIGLAGVLAAMLAVALVTRRMLQPLGTLAGATRQIAAGQFDLPLPAARGRDEISRLSGDFEAMRRSLKDYVRDLRETTAAKERIESELKVAHGIQASLLPRIFPPFPGRPEFDILAAMTPAKEVGGDFYDFFLVDEHHLCFLIADVSGKGVPAALYMMVAKTLLKTEGQRLREPGQLLGSVNAILAQDNDGCMFATVFCGMLDIRSGELAYASAAHNPPLVISERGVHYLAVEPALMLGPMEGVHYSTERLWLAPGETLFMYTDGVTEAQNVSRALFGEARLQKTLGECAPDWPLERIFEAVSGEVARHVDGAAQSDDITLLAVRLNRPGADGTASAAS